MSSEFKLEIGNNHDCYESEVGHQVNMSISEIVSPKQHRPSADIPFQRLVRPNRAAQTTFASGVDHKEVKWEYVAGKRPSGPLLSGAAYCLSSCSMILLNKVVLSTYNFKAGVSLMFYQNLISTVIVAVLSICGAVSVEKLSWKLIRVWLPVNLIFVGMLVSGMFSLKYMNIAMVTILKNVTNILTAIGEYYVFRRQQNQKVWTAMFLMIISAISGGITDLSFDATGYAWQIVNCILTASYSLTLRMVMDKAKQVTKSGNLNEASMNCGYNANVLGSSNVKRIVGTCNQLHIYVVSKSNRPNNL
uniref:Sugar phosphate transporter domain-containing protein n=1 Tax=Opuntia streptacantha TaxID=393608 RepID=A0A7C8YKS3_OPUST